MGKNKNARRRQRRDVVSVDNFRVLPNSSSLSSEERGGVRTGLFS
jgi:hypothetical protein